MAEKPDRGSNIRRPTAGEDTAVSRWLAMGLTLVLAVVAGLALVLWISDVRQDREREAAVHHARNHAAAVEARLLEAAGAVYAMEALVRAHAGPPGAFQQRSREILHRHPAVATLELQPGGVGSHVAPLAGNEDALGRDVLADPETGALSRSFVDGNVLGVAAPVQFPEGRQGAALRLPVFFPATGDPGQFWGFVSATLHLDDILDAAHRGELEEMGYRYALYLGSAEDEGPGVAGISPGELDDPVVWSFDVPGSTWIVALEPEGGWVRPLLVARDVAGVLLVSLLLAFVAGRVQPLYTARRRAARVAREAGSRHALLETVLAGTREGTAVFDADLRLQDSNPRWAELREYPGDLVEAGGRWEGFVRYDVERGAYGEGEVEGLTRRVLEGLRSGEGSPVLAKLPSGRTLEVRTTARPEGGYVETVTDLTGEFRALERLQVLFEGTSDGYILVRDGAVVDLNHAAIILTGADSREEVVGSDLPDYLDEEGDGQWLRALLERAREGEEVRGDWTLERHGLEPIPLDVTVRPLDSGVGEGALILVILHDLRGRRRVERAEEFLKAVLENSSALISVKDLEGRYLMVNAQWERVMGVSRGNALGQPEREIFAMEVAVERQRVDQQALEKEGAVTLEERIWIRGRVRTFVTTAVPVMGRQGEPEAVCRISTDVTLVEDFRKELEAAREGRESVEEHAGFDPEAAMEVVEELTELVASGDTEAVEVVHHLEEELDGTRLSDSARRIAGFVRNFQFEGARLELKILREELTAAEAE